jgi:membrane protein implicated in regulation of membrane protease activity
MPPDRTKHLLILGACWGLGLCAVLAGPVVGVFAIPFLLGVVLDVLDAAGAAPMLLFLSVALVVLPLSRPAVRARLRRAARLPLMLRNRSAGAPAQPT